MPPLPRYDREKKILRYADIPISNKNTLLVHMQITLAGVSVDGERAAQ
jgi:hypothetical protein